MQKPLAIFVFTDLIPAFVYAIPDDLKHILEDLDAHIAMRDTYVQQKEDSIQVFQKSLVCAVSPEET